MNLLDLNVIMFIMWCNLFFFGFVFYMNGVLELYISFKFVFVFLDLGKMGDLLFKFIILVFNWKFWKWIGEG